jgi:hypothetical protein
MTMKIHVRPAAGAAAVHAHPIDGAMPATADEAGMWAMWTADQFTFGLIRDGAIERVPDAPPAPSAPSPSPKARQRADAAE